MGKVSINTPVGSGALILYMKALKEPWAASDATELPCASCPPWRPCPSSSPLAYTVLMSLPLHCSLPPALSAPRFSVRQLCPQSSGWLAARWHRSSAWAPSPTMCPSFLHRPRRRRLSCIPGTSTPWAPSPGPLESGMQCNSHCQGAQQLVTLLILSVIIVWAVRMSNMQACTLGGVLSCGLTHTAVTPLDVVKCNMQIDPLKYKSIASGFAITAREGGLGGLVKGWVPTLIGYSVQGAGKFGLYEYFKKWARRHSSVICEVLWLVSELCLDWMCDWSSISRCSLYLQDICRHGGAWERCKVSDATLPGWLCLCRVLCWHRSLPLGGCEGIYLVILSCSKGLHRILFILHSQSCISLSPNLSADPSGNQSLSLNCVIPVPCRWRYRRYLALQRVCRMACPNSLSRKELQGKEKLLTATCSGSRLPLLKDTACCPHADGVWSLLHRLWKGITPLWGRQIPYTMMKFGGSSYCMT